MINGIDGFFYNRESINMPISWSFIF